MQLCSPPPRRLCAFSAAAISSSISISSSGWRRRRSQLGEPRAASLAGSGALRRAAGGWRLEQVEVRPTLGRDHENGTGAWRMDSERGHDHYYATLACSSPPVQSSPVASSPAELSGVEWSRVLPEPSAVRRSPFGPKWAHGARSRLHDDGGGGGRCCCCCGASGVGRAARLERSGAGFSQAAEDARILARRSQPPSLAFGLGGRERCGFCALFNAVAQEHGFGLRLRLRFPPPAEPSGGRLLARRPARL